MHFAAVFSVWGIDMWDLPTEHHFKLNLKPLHTESKGSGMYSHMMWCLPLSFIVSLFVFCMYFLGVFCAFI